MKLTVEERLELLLHIKWTVKQFDCQLTRELCDLLDREADLLNRGRPERSLEGALPRHPHLLSASLPHLRRRPTGSFPTRCC
jgi:hypothetical protein